MDDVFTDGTEEESPLESLEVDRRMLMGRTSRIFSIYRTGRQQQGRQKFGGRRSGRPWPENCTKCHRRRYASKQ